jgi:hypothetical protein
MSVTAPEGYVPMFIPLDREADVHALLAQPKTADVPEETPVTGSAVWSPEDYARMKSATTWSMKKTCEMFNVLALKATSEVPDEWVPTSTLMSLLEVSHASLRTYLAHFTMWNTRTFKDDRNWPIQVAWGPTLGKTDAQMHYRMSPETAKLWLWPDAA